MDPYLLIVLALALILVLWLAYDEVKRYRRRNHDSEKLRKFIQGE